MRFPRTVRFDISDTRIYETAAAPDEWAVSGAFAFAGVDSETLVGKARQAFVRGFLGTTSFGWSTFVTVAEITGTWIKTAGEQKVHFFSVGVGTHDYYEICFQPRSCQWVLENIHLER